MEPLQPGDPRRVGPYRLTGRLGAGGMGQVFLGVSPGGRKVAVKVIRAEHVSSPQFRARFAREVQAAQRVGGFHTAPVVDADPEAESPWLVTAFIPGPSLHQVVSGHGSLEAGAVRGLGAGLAEGLAAIHACGVVHRDLKPGNVIMAEDGPRIIDFGIARPADASSLTSAGVVIGTFAYMSPEQVRGELVGPAGDVFSLGCVLSFAATGQGPFDAPTIPAIVYRIINEEPRLDGVPGDLRELVGACLAKTPADRPGVKEILDRLGTHATDPTTNAPTTPPTAPPVTAERPATLRPARPPHRQPPTAPTATPTRTPTEDGGARPVDPAQTPAPTRSTLPRRALVLGALGTAGLAAVSYPVIRWLDADHPIATIDSDSFPVVFSPDGRTLATGSSDGPLRLWDVATRHNTTTLTGHTGIVVSVAFSPDGKTLASSSADRTVRLWDVATRRNTATFGDKRDAEWVAFSLDGKTLATGGTEETVRLWDVATGSTTATLTSTPGSVDYISSVAFSPDGRTLASGDSKGIVRLWDVATRRSIATLDHGSGVSSVAFSPDGRTLASGDSKGIVRLWDVATRRSIATLTSHSSTPQDVDSVAFSPDGRTLATGVGGNYRTVRLWDVATRKNTATLGHEDGDVVSVAFSPDGKTLASSCPAVKKVRLWKVR
ncbi:WD40 repeat domain-containing serine/threonine protein kinase [Actinoallomurus rhizosphaericola]|uniref:WD40 repeat domain-containing serine/threonine protein kinase n=1 Tax=Actinoallomurus rhizosphaericola TaxID=2952536 RepID=UPI0020938A98|nr:serine/threonine-protein kinase [Actinoallomurus rhizosphaericola]MCO5998904.1 serine/threonine protein kinase [Actinoallomurus rhizosphaericola]